MSSGFFKSELAIASESLKKHRYFFGTNFGRNIVFQVTKKPSAIDMKITGNDLKILLLT